MKPARPLRLILSAIVGLALAIGLAAQSASLALTRKAPATALSLFPLNGPAQEELATLIFISAAEGDDATQLGAPRAKDRALAAYRSEPLSPDAHAILALAEQNEKVRSDIVSLAAGLNRRNSMLQAVVLQGQVANQDYPGAIATLDRILRVRPSRSPELFPTLLPVFVREGAVDEFARILDGTSLWHEAFFRYAVRQPAALLNLVELRKRVPFQDQELDQTLLRNLVREDELDAAYEFYKRLGEEGQSDENDGELDWITTYPPFDWKLTDRAGLRAQPSRNSAELEISAKPGEGGVVARRFIKTPDAPFVFSVEHEIKSDQALQDIDVSLYCGGARQFMIFDQNLADLGHEFEVKNLPASCSFMELIIEARAWSGRSALDAKIRSVGIRN